MKGGTKKRVSFMEPPQLIVSTEEQWRSASSDKAEEILQLYLTGKHADCVFEIQTGTEVALVNKLDCKGLFMIIIILFLKKALRLP